MDIYSKRGKLNAIYNYKNNNVVDIIYINKKKYKKPNKSFVPNIDFIH